MNWDSSVTKVMDYRLDNWGIISGGGTVFLFIAMS